MFFTLAASAPTTIMFPIETTRGTNDGSASQVIEFRDFFFRQRPAVDAKIVHTARGKIAGWMSCKTLRSQPSTPCSLLDMPHLQLETLHFLLGIHHFQPGMS
jgi:hypothetical protein